MRSLSTIKNQAVAAGKNVVAAQVADVKKQTGIIGSANRILGETAAGKRKPQKKQTKDGVYFRHSTAAEGFWDLDEIIAASDGYVRRTPVQELCVAPDYRKRRIRKAVAAAAIVFVAALVVFAIYKLKLFSV